MNKFSLGTRWDWDKHVHPDTNVAVYAAEPYRISPDNISNGEGGWRADIWDVFSWCALSPKVFDTPEEAAKFIIEFHEKKYPPC